MTSFCSLVHHVLGLPPHMPARIFRAKNGIEDDEIRVVYRCYATLYFVFVVDGGESELGVLDLIQVGIGSNHRVVRGMPAPFPFIQAACTATRLTGMWPPWHFLLNIGPGREFGQGLRERVRAGSSVSLRRGAFLPGSSPEGRGPCRKLALTRIPGLSLRIRVMNTYP